MSGQVLKEYSLNQEWLDKENSLSQEWLKERILKGLSRSGYEPKEYSISAKSDLRK